MGEQSPIIDGHVKLRDGKKVMKISILFIIFQKVYRE
jgi:hypothetical protein